MFLKGHPFEANTAQRTETRVCTPPGPDQLASAIQVPQVTL